MRRFGLLLIVFVAVLALSSEVKAQQTVFVNQFGQVVGVRNSPQFVQPQFVPRSFVQPRFVSRSFVQPRFVSRRFVQPRFTPRFVQPRFVPRSSSGGTLRNLSLIGVFGRDAQRFSAFRTGLGF